MLDKMLKTWYHIFASTGMIDSTRKGRVGKSELHPFSWKKVMDNVHHLGREA